MKLALWQKTAIVGCIGFGTLAVATPALAAPSAHAPFEDSGSFSLIAQTVDGAAQLYSQDRSNPASPAVPLGERWSGNGTSTEYNAMGFNSVDGYIYAVSGGYNERSSGINDLLQIGSDGSVVNLGRITGLPNGRFYNSDTIVDGKNLIVTSQGKQEVFSIDLKTRTAVSTALSDKWIPADFAASVDPDVLWGVYQKTIQRLNLKTGAVDTFTNPIGSTSGGSIAAAPNGDLIFTEDGGKISQIRIQNPESADPSFTLISSIDGPGSSSADGTAIGERRDVAHQPFDPKAQLGFLVPADPGASQLYTVDVTKPNAPATPVGTPWTGNGATNEYNGIAFDKDSGYLYGLTKYDNTLVQIGKNGSVVSIAKLRKDDGAGVGGDFFNNGVIVGGKLIATGSSHQYVISIDLKTGVYHQTDLTARWTAADFTTNDGTYLWGVYKESILRLELATGRVTTFANTVTPKHSAIGGILNATDGDFIVSENLLGKSYRFHIGDPGSDRPTFTVVGTGTLPNTSDSDGASTVDAK